MLLLSSGHEAGDVFDEDQGDVVDVAETDESRALECGVDVDLAGGHRRVVRDESDDVAAKPPEGGDQVARPLRLEFEEFSIVRDLLEVERDVHGGIHSGGRCECTPEEQVFF